MAHVLVVDDDEFVRVTLSLLLQTAGHTVTTAASGRDALAAVGATRVDLVICDVFMPDMDGFETLRALKRRTPALPVVAISGERATLPGFPAPDYLRMAVELGAEASLRKPLDLKEVKAVVARCLAAAGHGIPGGDHAS